MPRMGAVNDRRAQLGNRTAEAIGSGRGFEQWAQTALIDLIEFLRAHRAAGKGLGQTEDRAARLFGRGPGDQDGLRETASVRLISSLCDAPSSRPACSALP